MTDRLTLYNGALNQCGERSLATLTENREARRQLDTCYDGALSFCLEKGAWTFACRTVKLEYDPDYTPDFGFTRVYVKPDDYVQTAALATDAYFTIPLTRFADEGGYWYCDSDEIYVKYISSDVAYGMNLSRWPESYTQLVETYLALQIVASLTNSEAKEEKINKAYKDALKTALGRDAMKMPPKFQPQNSWVKARRGGYDSQSGGW